MKTQSQLDDINEWTKKQKMELNEKKTKSMIFNFSKKRQFTTKLKVNELTKKAYKRMQLLHAASWYTNSKVDLKSLYLTFIRSVLEQSAVVWHSSLKKED